MGCQVSHTTGGDKGSQLNADDVMMTMRLAPKVVGTSGTIIDLSHLVSACADDCPHRVGNWVSRRIENEFPTEKYPIYQKPVYQ